MKDKGTAAILAFLLGVLGIHRFYLGQAGLGIVYFLFCWTPIIWIIAFVDFIVFLAESKESFDRKYNQHLASPQPYVQVNQHSYHQPQPMAQQPARQEQSKADQYERLEKLHNLKERGIISDEEYSVEKARILGHSTTGTETGSGNNWNDPFLG